MDLQHALASTMAPVKEVRTAAEDLLDATVVSPQVDEAVRLAGAVYFKNFVYGHWEKRESLRDHYTAPDEDKAAIKSIILEAIVHSSEKIRVQLALAFRRMVDDEYPTQNAPDFCSKLVSALQSGDLATTSGGLLAVYQIATKFEFRKLEERTSFDALIAALLPIMYTLLTHLAQQPTPESLMVLKQIVKIYYRAVNFELAPTIIVHDVFQAWMNAFLAILSMPVAAPAPDEDMEELPMRPIWKVKKWTVHILQQVFERFGLPTNSEENYKTFAQYYMTNWSVPTLNVILQLLSAYGQGHYQSPRVLQLSLRYVCTAIDHSKTWLALKPVYLELVQKVLFPLMCQSDADEALWSDDPYEYVRIKFDPEEDFTSPVQAASLLLQEMCQKRKKQTFDSIVAFCYSILNRHSEAHASPAEQQPRQKDGVLHMVGALGPILQKGRYRDSLEQLLVTFVFPEFSSPYGYLRARACFVMISFADINFHSNENIVATTQHLLRCLTDTALPVRVQAAVALRYMMRQPVALETVRPHIQAVMEALLILLRESENDDLTGVLQDLIEAFGDQLLPFAGGLCEQLSLSFMGMLDYDPTGDSENNKALAAMGVLSTLQTLLYTIKSREMQLVLEGSMMKVLSAIFGTDSGLLEFMEEALEIIAACTTESISANMWDAFAMMHTAFKRDAIDYFPEMVHPIYQYICHGKDVLCDPARPYMHMLFEMCKTVWEEYDGDDARWHAGKVMEVCLLCCLGKLDHVMPAFVGLAITHLLHTEETIRNSMTRLIAMNVVIAGLYYNPLQLLTTLQNAHSEGGETLLSRFMALWFTSIDSFKGLHNRKLGLLALLRLIEVPFHMLPSHAQQGRDEGEEELEDSEESGAEGDEDGEESDALEDDEDADETDYHEIIADYSAGLRSLGGPQDDDEFEEGQFGQYRTPLDEHAQDGIECTELHRILDELHQRDANAYGMLFSMLSQEQTAALEAIKQKSIQLMEARRSRAVAEQGGYNFGNCAIPSSFAFGQGPR